MDFCTIAALGCGIKLVVFPLVPLQFIRALPVMPFWRSTDFLRLDWELIFGMFVISALEVAPQSNVQSV